MGIFDRDREILPLGSIMWPLLLLDIDHLFIVVKLDRND